MGEGGDQGDLQIIVGHVQKIKKTNLTSIHFKIKQREIDTTTKEIRARTPHIMIEYRKFEMLKKSGNFKKTKTNK